MALNILHPGKITETTKATQAESVAGADNRKYMTPLRTKQVVDVVVDDVVEGALPAAIDTALAAAGPVFDDVLSVASVEDLPKPGVAGKIYIVGAIAHHWNGTGYDKIGFASTDELSEGTTNKYFSAALAAAAAPVQSVAGRTGAVTLAKADVGLPNVDNTSDADKPISTLVQTALAGKQSAGSYAPATGIDPSAITGTAVITTDARLSDARTPLSHDHTASQITDFTSAVAAAAPAPSTSANSGLSITGTALATSYNTAIADTVVSVPVGGAPAAAASTWKSKNLVQVLDDILFPTILASVGSAKSLNLAVSGTSGTLEIGTSVSRILTATFARGTILNGNGSTNSNPLVGAATGYTFTGTGISSTAQAGNTLSFTTPVVTGSNNWAVTATHAVGTGTYQDNKGVAGTNLDASRAAGSLTDSTSSPAITGVHPYYYLKSASPITAASMAAAIGNGTATKVVASSTGTLSIPYAPTAEYFAVAYPSTSTTKTRYFVTALDNGAITVVFSPIATQTVTTTLWTQDYRIHVTTAALTNSNSTIELRNT
jgi:hypothetical protein